MINQKIKEYSKELMSGIVLMAMIFFIAGISIISLGIGFILLGGTYLFDSLFIKRKGGPELIWSSLFLTVGLLILLVYLY